MDTNPFALPILVTDVDRDGLCLRKRSNGVAKARMFQRASLPHTEGSEGGWKHVLSDIVPRRYHVVSPEVEIKKIIGRSQQRAAASKRRTILCLQETQRSFL